MKVTLHIIEFYFRKEFKPTTAFSGIVNKRATPRASKQTPEVKVKEEKKPEVIKPKAEMTKPKSGLEQMFGKQKEKGSASQTSEKSSSSQASTSSATAKMSKPASTAAKKSKDIAGMFAKQVWYLNFCVPQVSHQCYFTEIYSTI